MHRFTHVLHSWYLCIQSFVLFFACFCALLHANSRLSKVSVKTKPRKAKFDAAQLPYEFSEAALVSWSRYKWDVAPGTSCQLQVLGDDSLLIFGSYFWWRLASWDGGTLKVWFSGFCHFSMARTIAFSSPSRFTGSDTGNMSGQEGTFMGWRWHRSKVSNTFDAHRVLTAAYKHLYRNQF